MQRGWSEKMRFRLSRDKQRTLRAVCIFAAGLFLAYFLTKFINIGYGPYTPDIFLDHHIPFLPIFILIYFGSYVYWLSGVLLVGSHGKKPLYELLTTAYVCFGVCFLFFVLLPTTIVRPEITESGVWNTLVRVLYRMDTPQNLFPSMHCLNSWLIFVAIRGKKEYAKWQQIFCCVFSFMVFASTVFLRQHFLVDIAGGVLLAELGTMTVRKFGLDVRFGYALDKTIMRGL